MLKYELCLKNRVSLLTLWLSSLLVSYSVLECQVCQESLEFFVHLFSPAQELSAGGNKEEQDTIAAVNILSE